MATKAVNIPVTIPPAAFTPVSAHPTCTGAGYRLSHHEPVPPSVRKELVAAFQVDDDE